MAIYDRKKNEDSKKKNEKQKRKNLPPKRNFRRA